MSAYPIRHLPKHLVSCGSQCSTIHGSFSQKCSQEVLWDALNVVAVTIPSVMSRLTLSPKLFLYSMTSSCNVPLHGLTVRGCDLLSTIMTPSAMDMIRGIITLFKFLYPTIASQNSDFFLLSEEKSGVLTLDN